MMSANDSDIHYISAERLLCLYGLERQYCTLLDNYRTDYMNTPLDKECIHLYPRFDGDYDDHLRRAIQTHDGYREEDRTTGHE